MYSFDVHKYDSLPSSLCPFDSAKTVQDTQDRECGEKRKGRTKNQFRIALISNRRSTI